MRGDSPRGTCALPVMASGDDIVAVCARIHLGQDDEWNALSIHLESPRAQEIIHGLIAVYAHAKRPT